MPTYRDCEQKATKVTQPFVLAMPIVARLLPEPGAPIFALSVEAGKEGTGQRGRFDAGYVAILVQFTGNLM